MVFETIAYTSSATPAILQVYRSGLWSYEAVEDGDVVTSGDRDRDWVHVAVMNPDRVARVSEYLQDIGRCIGEEIPGINVSSLHHAVHHSTSIRMDETAEQLTRIAIDDTSLPIMEPDWALMLHPTAMLREYTRPVVPVRRYGDAADLWHDADLPLVSFADTRDRQATKGYERAVTLILKDSEAVRPRVS